MISGMNGNTCASCFANVEIKIPSMNLRGMKIVVDCAHGATYHIAQNVLHELGAEVVAIGAQPDGKNINDGYGATAPGNLQKAVVEHGADVGIALDGDGDRLIMTDGGGMLYDGDQLLYIIARQRQEQGRLRGGVVGTLMTNLEFEHAMHRMSIPFIRAKVGDRYVMEILQERGWQIGGENSGHIICLDKHSTGDGIVSALEVLHALHVKKMTLAEISVDLQLYPQVLINVRVPGAAGLCENAQIKAAVIVVEGSVRARMDRRSDPKGRQVLPVLVHGDAAFAGQGVVMETLALAETRGYHTGGTVHIVINNQIGFTTSDPRDSRSTLYCSDVVKMIEAPVLHVNGDDPEAVVLATQIALDYRMEFQKDVVVDIICFRKLGHNEQDTPALTQPLMYKKIAQHPGTRRLYADKLAAQGFGAELGDEMVKATRAALDAGRNTFDPAPVAMMKTIAFSKAARVMMSRGLMSFSSKLRIALAGGQALVEL